MDAMIKIDAHEKATLKTPKNTGKTRKTAAGTIGGVIQGLPCGDFHRSEKDGALLDGMPAAGACAASLPIIGNSCKILFTRGL